MMMMMERSLAKNKTNIAMIYLFLFPKTVLIEAVRK